MKWPEIAVVFVDDDDLTAKAFALADNRVGDLGTYDDADLRALIEAVAIDPQLLADTSYSLDDFGSMVPPAIMGNPDDVPGHAPSKTVMGDVWLLGPHRLLCGDSTVPTDVDKLMAGDKADMVWTDPPYGMNLDTDYSKMKGGKKHRPVLNDDRPFDAAPLIAMFADVDEQFWWGADYYRMTIEHGGSWLVWDKHNGDGNGQYDELFGSSFELCWSRQSHSRRIERVTWATSHGRTVSDAGYLHPTQKPVALITAVINRHSNTNDIVLDLFGGSGSTLIAAHQTGRVARLIELDPKYCDVICKRWQQATGIKPIAESTGNEHDFMPDVE